MTPKQSGRSKLSQLVSHHVLGDVNGDVAPTIVHGNGVPHHLGEDCRGSRPSLDHPLIAGSVHVLDSIQQLGGYIGPLFQRSGHDYLRFFPRLRTIHLSVALLRRVL
jgi:hypothetical protein